MITLPIRVKEFPEPFYVTDALDRRLAYVIFEDDPVWRLHSKRVAKADAGDRQNDRGGIQAKFERSSPP